MEQEINLQGVIDQLQGENERLREKLVGAYLDKWNPLDGLTLWWASLDAQERVYLITGVCTVLVTLLALIHFLRG